MTVQQTMQDFPNAPDTVARYFDAMMAQDWPAFRATLADRLTRVGPYTEHDFPDPDAYTEFLASVLPSLESQQVDISRVNVDGATVHVELTESVVMAGGGASTVRVSTTFELDPDGRIGFIEVFVRRPTSREVGA
jgi:ketosteroid isomerase-like protein